MTQKPETERAFELGEWKVDPSLRQFHGQETTRIVGAKVMGVLLCLAGRPGLMVSKDELVAQAWEGDAASDEALTAVVYELRRALGDDARRPRYIGTVRGLGYRLLVAPQATSQAALHASPSASSAIATASLATLSAPSAASDVSASELSFGAPAGWPISPRRARPRRLQLAAAALLLALLALFVLPGGWRMSGDSQATSAAMLTRAPADSEIRSIAVLALEPRGEDPAFFARGLSEHLAMDLARSEWLEVVPAFSRANRGQDLSSRVSSRRVDAIVEGAVRQLGDRLWVTVQLISADGQLLWGGSWEETAGDLPQLEVELSAEISRRVRGRLGTVAMLAHSPEVDEALRLGRHFLDEAAPQEARRYFTFALERQPTLAPAHAGLADSLLASADVQDRPLRATTVDQARQAARTALEIDADLPAAHASLGTIALLHEGDLDAAGEHFERAALDARASFSSARRYAAYLSAAARHGESIDLLRNALGRTPASVEGRLDLARALYLGQRYDEALRELETLSRLAPEHARAARLRSEILLVRGELVAAIAACRQAVELAGGLEEVAAALDSVFDQAGLAGVVRCLRELEGEEQRILASVYDPLHLARLEALRGDAAAAVSLLEQAAQESSPELIWLAVDPAFLSLHHSMAFEELASGRRFST